MRGRPAPGAEIPAPGVLYAANGRLRAGWRLVLFALAVVAATLIVLQLVYPLLDGLAGALGTRLNAFYWLPFADWLTLAALALAHVGMLAWLDRRPWRDVGLGRAALGPRALGLGLALGAGAIALPTLLLVASHQLRVAPGARGSWIATAAQLLGRLAPPAAVEELFFRGYAFLALREGVGAPLALVFTSVAFGLAHLQNPGADAVSVAMVVLAGFFLGSIVLVTGSLWAAIAAHLAWNWTLAAALHTAVSGLPVPMPDYRLVDAGPDWLTGGAWGPEGGVAAGAGMLSALALLWSGGAFHTVFARRSAAGAIGDG